MKKLVEYVKRYWEILFLLLLWLIFLFIYSYKILRFPIFEDEAELLFVSEKVLVSPIRNLFVLMQYGPLPALSWLVALVSAFTKDTLLGGRLLNVFLASTLLLWTYLIKKIYNLPKRFFVYCCLLITFSPILLLNARVALWDTSVLVFSAWSIYFFLLTLKKPNLSNIVFFFVFLTFSFLIKFTSFFALPCIILILAFKFHKNKKQKSLYKLLATIIVSILVFTFLTYSFRTSVIGDAATSFITQSGPTAILGKIHNNVWLYINWLIGYYRFYPLYLIAFAYVILRREPKKTPEIITILLTWFFVSSFMMISFNRFFYPRHILILVLPIMTITTYFLLKVPLLISSLVIGTIIVLRIFLFRDIITNYFTADLAKEDRFQYFEDYTSGVNINDISGYLKDLSKNQKTVIWLDGTWVMEYGLRKNLKDNKNIIFKSFVNYNGREFNPPEKVVKDTFGVNYVIVNKTDPPNVKSFKLIREFSWNRHKRQYLYQVI